jgi:hypothetical protein
VEEIFLAFSTTHFSVFTLLSVFVVLTLYSAFVTTGGDVPGPASLTLLALAAACLAGYSWRRAKWKVRSEKCK